LTKFYGFVQKLYFDKQLRIEQGEILWRYFNGGKIVSWNLILLTRHPGVEQCFSWGEDAGTPPGWGERRGGV